MITNTWAYPPDAMREVFKASSSYESVSFSQWAERYEVSMVIAEPGRFLKRLVDEGGWRVVQVEPPYLVLVRLGGPDAPRFEKWRRPSADKSLNKP